MLKLKMNKWTAVAAVSLLLTLFGCSSGSGAENSVMGTSYPTATLHPVFASGEEFDSQLRETRDFEATETAMSNPTPSPRPSATDEPPFELSTTPTPAMVEGTAASEPPIDGIEVPILLYHHISVPDGGPAASGYEYFVSPEDFDAQMTYLEDNEYTPIDLYALFDNLEGTAELPDKPVVITFDDGSLDLYENAFPVLQAHNFTATFFVITDFIEEERPGYLTWDMVEEMADAGMRFETHSSNHEDLRGQTNDFLIRQVLDSQELLTAHIGYTPRFIAYPYGQYDDSLIQFLEENDFWGGLTAQGGLLVGIDNRFTWPRLYIPADTPTNSFAAVVTEGQTLSYQPELVEEVASSAPLTTSVSISTTEGMITVSAVLVYDEVLNSDWTVRNSPGVQFDLAYDEMAHNGDVSIEYAPGEDLGSFFLQVRPDAANAYLRDDIIGLSFWLYTGEEPLATEDLALIVVGSYDFPYWSAVDESIDPEEYVPTMAGGKHAFDLRFNRVISPETWVQVIIFFDDVRYDTDYTYITGLNLMNNAGVQRTFLIDEFVFILREP